MLPVTLFLLVAGRNPGGVTGIESWMLVELWTVPFLALSYWGWRRDRPWVAALAAAGATLIRELALPVVLLGLVLAIGGARTAGPGWSRPPSPSSGWASTSCSPSGSAAPTAPSRRCSAPARPGRSSPCSCSGGRPASVWCRGRSPRVQVVRRRLIAPVSALLAIPLLGLLVNRPYWGILATPFVLLWAGELIGDVWSERAAAGARQPTMGTCSDPRPAPSPTPPAPTSSRTPTAG